MHKGSGKPVSSHQISSVVSGMEIDDYVPDHVGYVFSIIMCDV